jgi:lysophospholipase L1-like esterase
MQGFGGLKYGCAVFIGTSITLGVRPGVTAPQALPVLAGITKGYVPSINAGIAGNNSTQMLARFEPDVLAYGPTMVALECGHNDPGASIAVGSVGSAGTYTDNIARMIVKAQRTGARVTLWVPIYTHTTLDANVAPYRTAMRALAVTYGCDLFDLYADIVALAGATQNSYYIESSPLGQHMSPAGLAWAAGKVGAGAYANSFVAAVKS